MNNKICANCKRDLPVSEFNHNKNLKDGFQSLCKECIKIYQKEYYSNNKDAYEKSLINKRNYYKNNKIRLDPIKKVYRDNNKDKRRDCDLRNKFGITLEDYNEMFKLQDGRCYICKEQEVAISNMNHSIKALAVDHDHKTGEVRGLLCQRCNNVLGKVHDSVFILENMIIYLNKK